MGDILRFTQVLFLIIFLLLALIAIPVTIIYILNNPIDRDTFYVVALSCIILFTV